jgi:uncharacterized protein (TIGR02270 family)
MIDSFTNSELEFIDIYEQYLDQASFLWLMHTIAVDQPHYTVKDLTQLELRLDAQLSGMLANLALSWKICQKALELEGGGELFTASIIAFRSRDQKNIQTVVEAATVSDECFNGLVYALAWLPGNLVHDWIRKFFVSKDINHKYLAVETCNLRGENPAEYLSTIFQREDCLEHTGLYISSLKSVAMFKRHDLAAEIYKAIDHDDKEVKFWALRAAILLGDIAQSIKLEPFCFEETRLQKEALQLAFRALPVNESKHLVNKFAQDPAQIRNIIIVVGNIGDPQAVEWLLNQMQASDYARVAAESFCMITGIDLELMGMTQAAPENYQSLPLEDADDENVKMHDDENLPWPDAVKINAYWSSIKGSYIFGQRYLLGKQIELESLKQSLPKAYQRQRHAVALELALLNKDEPLFNTRRIVSYG